jgi:hypothetical protein
MRGKFRLEGMHLQRMYLSPKQWTDCALAVSLNWTPVEFTAANKAVVPDNLHGVYSFVAQPRIANHPACAYLLYVGKADKTSFRTRYLSYLKEKNLGDQSRRIHIEEMLTKLDGYLWFYYAPIDDTSLISATEDELLSAFLPPSNKTFPATVSRALKRIFGN